jgi:dsRNA-specific ribonuclease
MTELKTVANGVFKRFPNENKVFVTSDGQAFLDETHAKNHARSNRTGKELKLETFLREDEKKDAEKTAAQWIELIAALTEVKDVQDILAGEKAGKKRKSVVEAAESKIVELSKPE